jgi:hypothetical protein
MKEEGTFYTLLIKEKELTLSIGSKNRLAANRLKKSKSEDFLTYLEGLIKDENGLQSKDWQICFQPDKLPGNKFSQRSGLKCFSRVALNELNKIQEETLSLKKEINEASKKVLEDKSLKTILTENKELLILILEYNHYMSKPNGTKLLDAILKDIQSNLVDQKTVELLDPLARVHSWLPKKSKSYVLLEIIFNKIKKMIPKEKREKNSESSQVRSKIKMEEEEKEEEKKMKWQTKNIAFLSYSIGGLSKVPFINCFLKKIEKKSPL